MDGGKIGAEHVAQVAYKIASHDRVKINHAKAFQGCIKEHIADFRIVMSNPASDLWVAQYAAVSIDNPRLFMQRTDFTGAGGDTCGVSCLKCLLELVPSEVEVMEGWDGIPQLGYIHLFKASSEFTKSKGSLVGFFGSSADIDGM